MIDSDQNNDNILDVLVVGAGLSGISAAYYLKTHCPWANFKVFEARESLGGTWDLFKYPGIRSDSDMFTLGFSFNPWKEKQSIADGPAILKYLNETAVKFNLLNTIEFSSKIISADWNSDASLWKVVIEKVGKQTTETIQAKFLFFCSGYYNYDQGYLPEFKGIKTFKNSIVHPQFWPQDLDYKDKTVVVIGSGATAITLVPALTKQAAHVTMLQRSPTYIVSLPKEDPVANLIDSILPDKVSGPIIRWMKALVSQASYRVSKLLPKQMASLIKMQVKNQLPKDFDVDRHFTPKYNPWDQRLCVVPNGDLFSAIRHGKASVVTDEIESFTENGILLKSGSEINADIVVTATGLDLVFLGKTQVTIDSVPINPAEKMTYRGMMLQNVPNLVFSIGYTNASWTLKCELICDYTVRMLNKMKLLNDSVVFPTIDNDNITSEQLMGLTSGYILRAGNLLPKQGNSYPWKVYQSYLKDYMYTKSPNSINDKFLKFTDKFVIESQAVSSS
jgi:cation diffusion facilitator CzcD-associated flavoprotein CzcO